MSRTKSPVFLAHIVDPIHLLDWLRSPSTLKAPQVNYFDSLQFCLGRGGGPDPRTPTLAAAF